MKGATSRRTAIGVAAMLVVLAVVPYLQTWSHAFLTYDDPLYVTNNSMVQRGLTMSGVKWAFTTFHACNWHPLTWLSHMIDCAVFDVNPRGPLMVNMVLHAINAVLLWLVLWRMNPAAGPAWMWRSAAVAAVFAVHPLHVESVAWISERKDLLSTLFGLLAVSCYIGWTRRGGAGLYLLMLLWFAVSLLCKPMLVTLPCVLLLLDFWPLERTGADPTAPLSRPSEQHAKRGGQTRGKKSKNGRPVPAEAATRTSRHATEMTRSWPGLLGEKLPLFALSIASCIVTVFAQSSGEAVQTLQDVSMSSRLANAVNAYAAYIGKFLAPVNLAVFYPRDVEISPAKIGFSAIIILIITGLTVWQRRQRPWLIVGWLFFLGTLVPVIGLLQVGWQSMADRYMYVPMIGLSIAAAWSIPVPRQVAWKVLQGAAIVGVVVVLAIVATVQAGYWQNSVTLFQRAWMVTTDNHVTRCNLGNALLEAQKPNEALEHLLAAAQLNERTPLTHYDLGIAYRVLGRLDKAEAEYRRAVELSPTYAQAWANLASTLSTMARYSEAVNAAENAIANDPDLAEGHICLGEALAKSGQVSRAISEFRRGLEIKPRAAVTRMNLGICLISNNQGEEGLAQLKAAIVDNPNLVDARMVLAKALEQRGELAEAIVQVQQAARLKPGDPVIQQRLRNLQQTHPQVSGGG